MEDRHEPEADLGLLKQHEVDFKIRRRALAEARILELHQGRLGSSLPLKIAGRDQLLDADAEPVLVLFGERFARYGDIGELSGDFLPDFIRNEVLL